MKTTLFEALMQLLHQYLEKASSSSPPVENLLQDMLSTEDTASTPHTNVYEPKTSTPLLSVNTTPTIRIYTNEECEKLDDSCRGFLLYLEQLGLLSLSQRELVIEKVMENHAEYIELEELKWLTLAELSKDRTEEEMLYMENLFFAKTEEPIH